MHYHTCKLLSLINGSIKQSTLMINGKRGNNKATLSSSPSDFNYHEQNRRLVIAFISGNSSIVRKEGLRTVSPAAFEQFAHQHRHAETLSRSKCNK